VQHEFNAEGTIIKEDVKGYTLPFSGSHVPQISPMWAYPYMAMTCMKFADMAMSYIFYSCAYVQRYTVH
jgi:hypothetical protein